MSVDYLRISVTDKCNLQCIYCNPLGGCDVAGSNELLTTEEIKRVVRLCVDCGIRKVRVTGGEPLLREDIVRLVGELDGIPGIDDISLTTNGVFLESFAAKLKAVGLRRINVSVDSIDREIYKQITGFDLLPSVIEGIHKAMEVDLTPIKINSVIIKGLNDSPEQIVNLAQVSIHLPIAVRFIEYCPTNTCTRPAVDYVPNRMVRTIIERAFGSLSGVVMADGNGPALYFKIKDSAGAIGFISGRSSIFCQSCNRLRLTSDGKLMPCLYSVRNYDLRRLLKNGTNDERIRFFLRTAISEKARFTKLNSYKEEFSMCGIGG